MTAVPKYGAPTQRIQPYRNKTHLQAIARLPCKACGYSVPNEQGFICQAAHIGTLGRGIKNHDYYTIPLCPPHFITLNPPPFQRLTQGCHTKFDAGQERFARETWGLSLDELREEAANIWAVMVGQAHAKQVERVASTSPNETGAE